MLKPQKIAATGDVTEKEAGPETETLDFELVLSTFFEEVIDALTKAEDMMAPVTHGHIYQKFLDFFAYRIPGVDTYVRDIGMMRIPRKSLHKRLIAATPDGVKRFVKKFGWLYILVIAIDALIFPSESARRRISMRGQLARRIPTSLRFRLSHIAFLRSLDERIFRPRWKMAETQKPLWKFSKEEIAKLTKALINDNAAALRDGLEAAQKLDADPRDVYVFVSHLFPTTWSPHVRALNDRGDHTVWCGIDDPHESAGYGVLESPLVPVTTHVHLTFLGVIVFLCATRRCQILMSGECFYGSNWNAEDTTVLYSLLSSVLYTMRRRRAGTKNLTLLMYDGLKPINLSGNPKNNAITHFYKRLMHSGDRIIYNSNTELLGTFNQYSIPLKTPRLHFYRYSEAPHAPKPRIDLEGGKNIHIACITVCLNEFGEPSRDMVAGYVRDIILSGIHFHYYCMTEHPVIQKFKRDLGEYGKYLHLHPIIKDQAKLVGELHQYHAGFNPSDHVPFAHGISSLNDRFYQDAMSVFLQSTIGTSFLVYAAAGLPVLLPRGCVGATQLLGDVALPIIFAEMSNLRSLLEDCDLERRLALADQDRTKVHIDTHIDRFVEFMKR